MKKFIPIFIVVLLLCFVMFYYTGCSIGYKAVQSVTFTTNGVNKTCRSGKTNVFGHQLNITEEEYNEKSKNRYTGVIDSIQTPSLETILKKANGKTTYKYVEEKLEGYWYWTTFNTNGGLNTGTRYYWKKQYYETNYYFVYVKVVNDTTLKIKDSKGETTYTVSNYRITYFQEKKSLL